MLWKSLHKSNSFRRESISKLLGGKPMNVFVFGLWSSYHIWQLWNALMPRRVGLVRTFLTEEWCRSDCHLVKKSLHMSNLFRRESISKFSWFFNWFCLSYSLPTTIVFRTRWPLLLTDCGWSIKPLPNLIWCTVFFYDHHQTWFQWLKAPSSTIRVWRR